MYDFRVTDFLIQWCKSEQQQQRQQRRRQEGEEDVECVACC